MKSLSFLSAVIILTSCSNSSNTGSDKSPWSHFVESRFDGLRPASSLAQTKIPIVTSPSYEEAWGEPKIELATDGGYALSYANPEQPFDRLVIHGSTKPFPALASPPKVSGEKLINGEITAVDTPQKFRSANILGKSVRWFQESTSGGADGAYYSTEGFSARGGFGSTGYYRIVVEAGDNAEAEVSKRFSSVKVR